MYKIFLGNNNEIHNYEMVKEILNNRAFITKYCSTKNNLYIETDLTEKEKKEIERLELLILQ